MKEFLSNPAVVESLIWCIPSVFFLFILCLVAHSLNRSEEKKRKNSRGGGMAAE